MDLSKTIRTQSSENPETVPSHLSGRGEGFTSSHQSSCPREARDRGKSLFLKLVLPIPTFRRYWESSVGFLQGFLFCSLSSRSWDLLAGSFLQFIITRIRYPPKSRLAFNQPFPFRRAADCSLDGKVVKKSLMSGTWGTWESRAAHFFSSPPTDQSKAVLQQL